MLVGVAGFEPATPSSRTRWPASISGRGSGLMQVVGMMVSVTVLELLDGHSEEARRIPEIDAGLHQPGRASVP